MMVIKLYIGNIVQYARSMMVLQEDGGEARIGLFGRSGAGGREGGGSG